MGVAYSTFNLWKRDYLALSEALKKGKEVVDIEVENALHQSAMGYHYTEEKTYIDEVNGEKRERKEIYRRYAEPKVSAQIFWLKNRMTGIWRNNIEVEEESTQTVTIINDTK